MTRFRPVLLALVLLAATIGPASAQQKMPWAANFAAAKSQAAKSKKLIMVDFYTDWCTYCKKLDKETYTDARVLAKMKGIVPVKLNAEKEGAQLARQHGVTGYPTMIFLDAAANPIGRIGGFVPANAFVERVDAIVAQQKEIASLRAKNKAAPTDIPAAVRLGSMLAGQGDPAGAAAIVDRAAKSSPKHNLLPSAWIAIGFGYLQKRQAAPALPHFKRAAAVTSVPAEKAQARLGVAAVLLEQKKTKEAVAELKAVATMPGAPAPMKERAQQVIDQLSRRGG